MTAELVRKAPHNMEAGLDLREPVALKLAEGMHLAIAPTRPIVGDTAHTWDARRDRVVAEAVAR